MVVAVRRGDIDYRVDFDIEPADPANGLPAGFLLDGIYLDGSTIDLSPVLATEVVRDLKIRALEAAEKEKRNG